MFDNFAIPVYRNRMVDVPDEDELLRGEDEIYDLWLETEKQVVEAADRLQLTEEELEKIQTRWASIGNEDGQSEAHAVAALAKHVLVIRGLRKLTNMMRPGEEMVPLTELAARLRSKGEA